MSPGKNKIGNLLLIATAAAAAVAMSNRLPILFLPGDTYANRMPDPVLQQVEHFNNPGITANDAFKPVTRYFDRITRPEQIIQSFPAAVQTMLDPADCGPACGTTISRI